MDITINITLEDIQCLSQLNTLVQLTDCPAEVWKVWVDFVDKIAVAVHNATIQDE